MDQPTDWALCRKHWPLAPRILKARIRRAWKRHHEALSKGVVNADNALTFQDKRTYLDHVRAAAAYDRLCRLAVRKAIEAALGIG